jgi:glucose/arabinose dehydrogenase
MVFRMTGCSVPSERQRARSVLAILTATALLALAGCSARAAPVDNLRVPPGFSIALVNAKIPGARFLAVAPKGDIVVSEPGSGRVVSLPANATQNSEPRVVAEGIPLAHGLAFRGSDLYIAGRAGVSRLSYPGGQPTALFSNMPQGGDHNNRALALSKSGAIFVSSGSSCNVCDEPDPRFATVLRYDPTGGTGRIYASGLRNASGLAFDESGRLWAVINGRDNIGDDLPPEELVEIKDGGNYGWPYCYAAPGGRVPNPEYNDQSKCSRTVHPGFLYQAHSAPLQITFYDGKQFPQAYRGAAFVAMHGSWNRSVKTGYKVVAIFFKDGKPDHAQDFVTGFLGSDQSVSGRPVGVAVGQDGSLYISDDLNGAIYRVTYKPKM